MIYIGEVIDINDPAGGDRIKVRILPEDKWKDADGIDYAFPLLPKTLHVKPKVGEAVLVICADDNNQASQRYYIGPIISQPQDMFYEDYQFNATSLIKGGVAKPKKSIGQNQSATGSLAKDDETAFYSRRNSDIIMSDNDIRIRCGSRLLTNNSSNTGIEFNKKNPSYIKLKYHEQPLDNKLQPNSSSHSSATIVADEINLLSNKSKDPLLGSNELYDPNEQINDENMQKIINEAHVLPYGDVLVDFLMDFLQMFKSHTHKYANDTPCEDDFAKALDQKYGRGSRQQESNDFMTRTNNTKVELVQNTFKGLYDKLLSKNIRIN